MVKARVYSACMRMFQNQVEIEHLKALGLRVSGFRVGVWPYDSALGFRLRVHRLLLQGFCVEGLGLPPNTQ